jgi:polysaccharide export outer membrane protein
MMATGGPCLAQEPKAPEADNRVGEHEYVIGPGDLLEVAVWDNTVVSRTVPVRPDGKISLPLLHDVQAAGLTPMQLTECLNTALVRYIETPAVSVIVREVHSFKVSVLGEVKTPGRFELTGRTTVLDALAMAGGLNEFADRGRIVILRREGMITRQIPFAYDRLTPGNGSKGQENFFVQPADIVLVR